jgi:uncharacterized repeat protein (TIGR03806 family)
MRMRPGGLWVAGLVLGCGGPEAAAGSTGDPSSSTAALDTTTGVDGPVLPPRPDVIACRFDGIAPGMLPELEPAPALTELDGGAVDLASSTDRLFVATPDRRIVAVASDAGAPLPVLSLDGPASRLVALALAPDHAATGHLYVRYEASGGSPRTVVARYTVDPDTGVVSSDTARTVLELDGVVGERSGGALIFGPDGLLYVGVGTTTDEAAQGLAIDPTSWRGKLLRIDPSTLDATGTYAIPADNPWIGEGGASDEVWAMGLRDPWRCTFAPDDPDPWCIDVGATQQEIDHVAARADLGWPRVDGTACLLPGGDCGDLQTAPPFASYRSVDGDCGISGIAWGDDADDGGPGLAGVLIYGDRCSGRIRGVDTGSGDTLVQDEILAVLDPPPSALAHPLDGRILALADDRVVELGVAPQTAVFPTRLSDAGCFDDLAARVPAPGVVPYGVNAALWTDDAAKDRFLVIPPGETIAVGDDGGIELPIGSIVLKLFAFDFAVGDPSSRRNVEARVMIRRPFGWQFHSYRFDADGADATLLAAGEVDPLSLDDHGQIVRFDYTWPSRGNCKVCHGLGASDVLGVRLDQLAGTFAYDAGVADQLEALASIDLFSTPLPAVTPMARPDDTEVSIEQRARAYLHTNCGHCHRPGGWTPADLTMDLRYDTPLVDAHICGVATQYYNAWVTSEIRIAPGDPDGSVIWQRIGMRGLGQMPPLATARVDPGNAVVGEWIASLAACP